MLMSVGPEQGEQEELERRSRSRQETLELQVAQETQDRKKEVLGEHPLPCLLMTYLPERRLSQGLQHSSDFLESPPNQSH